MQFAISRFLFFSLAQQVHPAFELFSSLSMICACFPHIFFVGALASLLSYFFERLGNDFFSCNAE